MANANGTLASAVVLPEITNSPDENDRPTLKRKQSPTPEQDPKRPRLSVDRESREPREATDANGDVQPAPAAPTESGSPTDAGHNEPHRKSTRDEEKKRSRRLFGGLLGTLSQNSTTTAQRKRTEIEQKQQAKLRAQEEEHEEDRKKRMEELAAQRKVAQKRWDDESLHMRHPNKLATARMLRTKSEPQLYYLPYELREHEEETIRQQVQEAEAEINEKSREFESGKEQDSQEFTSVIEDQHIAQHRVISPMQAPNSREDVNGNDDASRVAPEGQKSETNLTDDPSNSSPKPEGTTKEKTDENEDVMLETGEDSVIY